MQVVVTEVCASLTFSEADEVAANPLTTKKLDRTVKLRITAPSSADILNVNTKRLVVNEQARGVADDGNFFVVERVSGKDGRYDPSRLCRNWRSGRPNAVRFIGAVDAIKRVGVIGVPPSDVRFTLKSGHGLAQS